MFFAEAVDFVVLEDCIAGVVLEEQFAEVVGGVCLEDAVLEGEFFVGERFDEFPVFFDITAETKLVGDSLADRFDVGMYIVQVEDPRITRGDFAFEDEEGVDVKGSIFVALAGDAVVSDRVLVEPGGEGFEEDGGFAVIVGVRKEEGLCVEAEAGGFGIEGWSRVVHVSGIAH